jgi:hypothetical protein
MLWQVVARRSKRFDRCKYAAAMTNGLALTCDLTRLIQFSSTPEGAFGIASGFKYRLKLSSIEK